MSKVIEPKEQAQSLNNKSDRLVNSIPVPKLRGKNGESSINFSDQPQLQRIIDALPFYALLIDEDHNILMANKAVEKSLGADKDKIIGKYCPLVIHGLKTPFPGCPLESSLKKGREVERELYDENYKLWLKAAVYPTELKTKKGKRVYYHTVRDITEEKHVKEELESKSELLDRASDSIFVHDFDGKMIYVNGAAYKTRAYTKKELLNLPLQKLDSLETAKLIKPRIEVLLKKGEVCFEGEHLKKNKEVLPVEVHARLTKYMGKEVITSIVRDISERKLAEAKLYEAQHKLEERVKDRTSKLLKSNLLLEEEIAERNKAENELKKSVKKLKQTLEETVHALASIVEARDSYTSGHQQRVAHLATAIAKEMGFSKKKVEGIKVAATLHDIGKLFIPAEILNKPSHLSELEFSLIKTHSQIGYEILKSVKFPWPVAKIIIQHHERINGEGYPNGLKGNNLLIEAKILAVADVVEAMSSHRPYRPALGLEKALEEISRNKGILYDEQVVAECLKLFKEKNYKFCCDFGSTCSL